MNKLRESNSQGGELNPDQIIPFGREEVIRMVFDRLTADSIQGPQCVALIGPPFVGKSKILDCITDPTIQNKFQLNLDLIYPIRFDCGNISLTRTSALKTLGNLAIDVITEKWNIHTNNINMIINKITRSENPVEIKLCFDELLAFGFNYGRSLVYVLDHFEKLLSLFDESDVQFMRDMFSNYRHALVVAIPKPMIDLAPKTYPSEFYRIFRYYDLKPFGLKQAEQYLVNQSNDSAQILNQENVQFVLKKAGYHPHFLAIYKKLLLKEMNFDYLNQDQIQRLDQEALDILSKVFLRIWQEIDINRQRILNEFAKGLISEDENIAILQSLESEFGVLYRNNGHFHIMGDLFKHFILSQTQIIDHIAKRDFFVSGVNALLQLKDEQYWGTDPIIYFKQAYWEYSKDKPDFITSLEMSRQAFEKFFDMLVKSLERKTKRLCSGEEINDKIYYLEQVLGLEKTYVDYLINFVKILNNFSISEISSENLNESIFRFCSVSTTIQFLVNKHPKYSVLANSYALEDEYEILDKIGETNHSALFKAQHRLIRTRYVAIKTVKINSNDNDLLAQFQEQLIRESEIVASLNHSNIGKVYHLVLNPLKVIMEWIDGQSLEYYLKSPNKTFTTSEIVTIGIKLAEILEYAHSKGVIHRDIKPSNIILRSNTDPVLVDFDISRAANVGTISLTNDGSYGFVGTIEYSSPEQFLDPKGVKASSDIFSLGILLYKLLTNKLPYPNGNHPITYENEHFPKPEKFNVPDDLFIILTNCLSESPNQRIDASNLKLQLTEYFRTLNS